LYSFKIKPQSDEPKGDTEYLGIWNTCDTLIKFIESENIVTPMSIAIHGQWGSGKTNLLRALEKNLDYNRSTVIFFEAWKHESGNPAVALVTKIMSTLYGDAGIIQKIVEIAADAIVRKTMNMKLDEIVNSLWQGFSAAEDLSKELEKAVQNQLGGKQLVLLIDDLDRCDIENTLLMLALIKLFLDIKDCICVAAIDFQRVEQAWFSKYGIEKVDGESEWEREGRQYLEKIFQIRVPIPHPILEERRKFIDGLVPSIPGNLLDLLAEFGPVNPRGIKRMLNLVSYRTLQTIDGNGQIAAILWTLLEEILWPENAVRVYEILDKKRNGIIEEILNYSEGHWGPINTVLGEESITPFKKPFADGRFKTFFLSAHNFLADYKDENLKTDFRSLYKSSKELQND